MGETYPQKGRGRGWEHLRNRHPMLGNKEGLAGLPHAFQHGETRGFKLGNRHSVHRMTPWGSSSSSHQARDT
jgi:hypothetical protein